jgi:Holliday junction DNA helicase RuvA
MIARLSGVVVERLTEALVIDVHGVGYEVNVPRPLLISSALGEPLTVSVVTVVREDAFLLYGFARPEDREVFNTLCSVSSVGPKVAMGLLSTLTAQAIARAIASDDVAALAKAPGVGKRTAARLCLELKDKLPAEPLLLPGFGPPPAKVDPADPLPLALARLDYRKSEIDAVVNDPSVPALGAATVELRLSAALRLLMRAP